MLVKRNFEVVFVKLNIFVNADLTDEVVVKMEVESVTVLMLVLALVSSREIGMIVVVDVLLVVVKEVNEGVNGSFVAVTVELVIIALKVFFVVKVGLVLVLDLKLLLVLISIVDVKVEVINLVVG